MTEKQTNQRSPKTTIKFYKNSLRYLIAYCGEKQQQQQQQSQSNSDDSSLEKLVDCIRMLTIKYGKLVASILQDEYVSILNAVDFGSGNGNGNGNNNAASRLNETNKRKLLEMIHWLPKISRFLLSKLAILVLHDKLSVYNVNHVLEMIKERAAEASENTPTEQPCVVIDDSNYVMFLACLFNGYQSFELMNSDEQNDSGDYVRIDLARFQSQTKLMPVQENTFTFYFIYLSLFHFFLYNN